MEKHTDGIDGKTNNPVDDAFLDKNLNREERQRIADIRVKAMEAARDAAISGGRGGSSFQEHLAQELRNHEAEIQAIRGAAANRKLRTRRNN
jgi:hypothetical protein